jgi:hypothetical protein
MTLPVSDCETLSYQPLIEEDVYSLPQGTPEPGSRYFYLSERRGRGSRMDVSETCASLFF